jgi:hypothetical protein
MPSAGRPARCASRNGYARRISVDCAGSGRARTGGVRRVPRADVAWWALRIRSPLRPHAGHSSPRRRAARRGMSARSYGCTSCASWRYCTDTEHCGRSTTRLGPAREKCSNETRSVNPRPRPGSTPTTTCQPWRLQESGIASALARACTRTTPASCRFRASPSFCSASHRVTLRFSGGPRSGPSAAISC